MKKAAERPGGEGRRQVDAEAERARLESFLIESKLSVLTHNIRRAGVSSLAELVRPCTRQCSQGRAAADAWSHADMVPRDSLVWPRDSLTW